MAKMEPLLPTTTPRKKLLPSTPPSTLCLLPKDGETSISFSPFPASPSLSLKEHLIFGSSSSDLPSSISPEALSLNACTPSSLIAPADRIPLVPQSSITAAGDPSSPSWLTEPSAATQGWSNLHRSCTTSTMSAINAHATHGQQPSSASPNSPSIVRS